MFDCFLFHNELDLLEIRLREMGPVVDRFVLVEARETFQGDPKPLTYAENVARFAAWRDRIIHVVVPAGPVKVTSYGEVWSREHHQRDQIALGLAQAGPHDLVLVSDVDEILRRDVVRQAVERFEPGQAYVFSMGMYRFDLNRREAGTAWQGPRLIERRRFPGAQRLRRLKSRASKRWLALGLAGFGLRWRNWAQCGVFVAAREILDAGWHFSSIGGYQRYRDKVDAFSHTEYKQTAEYRSAAAFDAWVARHRVEPTQDMPACVADDARFSALLAR